MSFKDKSIKELEAIQLELSKTLEEKKEEEQKRINEIKSNQTKALIIAAVENPLILDLFPHVRNSCDDSLKNAIFNYEYNTARCNRCLFEEMVRDYESSFNKDDFEPHYLVNLEMSFTSKD